MPAPDRFPNDFLWGASTSAYQIEGSPLADGAGPSIWHRFAHERGTIADKSTGDVACDHYRRYEDDARLMAELGLNAYRFSISWSRIFPEGIGQVNQAGIDFYSRLVDALLEHGIQPNVTLFHWDLPAALDERGGWLNPDVADWFARYARTMFEALDDRVPLWVTLNEPWVVMDGGYVHGVLAPGHRSVFEGPRAAHNLLRAHGAAVDVYRDIGRHQIGIVVNLEPKIPASDRPEDIVAAKRADAYMNRLFLDPLFRGTYPDELTDLFGTAWIHPPESDFDGITRPIDFLGVNYYKTCLVRDDPDGFLTQTREVPQRRATHTDIGWPVCAEGLTDTLVWVHTRYGAMPTYITENGAAFYDPPCVNGEVPDPLRTNYLKQHLLAAHQALQRGVDLRGYYAWSLLDNFEWSQGLSKRFGIVHVDFETQQRTVKSSGKFYRDVIKSDGAVLFAD